MDPIWMSGSSNSSESHDLNNLSFNSTEFIELPDLATLDKNWQILIIILFTTAAIISLLSNIITIIVLLKGDRLPSDLWKYLINLSVADIIMAIFVIPTKYTHFLYGRWLFFSWSCPVVPFILICSSFVSVYILVVIGIDSYVALAHPLRTPTVIKSYNNLVITAIWIIGVAIGSLNLFNMSIVEFAYGKDTYYDCRENGNVDDKYLYIFIFIVIFALPVSALIFVYTSNIWLILRHNTTQNQDQDQVIDLEQLNNKVKVVKMLLVISVLYIICWAPIQILMIMIWYIAPYISTHTSFMIYTLSYFFCEFLSMSHSFMNPFVYYFMNENFKSSLRMLFRQLWRKQLQKEQDNQHANTLQTELENFSGSHVNEEMTPLNS